MKSLRTSFLLAAAVTSIQADAQSLTDLGTLGGSESYASAVSADGSVVVGQAKNASNQHRVFRWTSGIMTDLGTSAAGDTSLLVSADGSTVVGTTENAVRIQIWTALSADLLVAILKKTLKLKRSLHEILQVISVTPFNKVPIPEIFARFERDSLTTEIAFEDSKSLF